ncbi:hypothetical protein NM688_g2245 [Phlebia brevispora]|uniref:Uncharacterized protein n=1 Tax=Phlebia brevispora TaxID=194682 RepID=A0ACC1T928_9APHY|nr:hypothetical protein NM688_g2245 [Phlebia brevispora]
MLHVYVAAALAINAVTVGSLIIAVLLLVSAGLLGVCNSLTKDLHMWGRRVYVTRREGPYKRRSAMVKALVKELKAPQQVEPASLTMKWVTKMDLLTEEALHATLTESPSTDCNATPKVAPTHGSGSRSPSIDDKAAITPSVLEVPSYLP